MAVDGDGELGFGGGEGGVVGRPRHSAVQDQEAWAKLGDGEDVAVDRQLHADVGGMTGGFCVVYIHG